MFSSTNSIKRCRLDESIVKVEDDQVQEIEPDLNNPEPSGSSRKTKTEVEESISVSDSEADLFPSANSDSDEALQIEAGLKNHLILKGIFKHLPVSDLLNFSLVNHFWNSCARNVLREQKKCVAFIHGTGVSRICWEVKQLDGLLLTSINTPINGLTIRPSKLAKCVFEDYYTFLLSKNPLIFDSDFHKKLSCKYLTIHCMTLSANSPGDWVFEYLIKSSASTLEELSINGFWYDRPPETIRSFLQLDLEEDSEPISKASFPKLKLLKVPPKSADSDDDEKRTIFVTELLRAAPNVRSLKGGISPGFVPILIEINKLGAVKEFDLEHDQAGAENDDSELIEWADNVRKYLSHSRRQPDHLKSKLTKILISSYNSKKILNENQERWLPVVSELYTEIFNTNSDTLEELIIHHLDLILLSRIQIQSLHRVHHLTINLCPKLAWTLSQLNYSQMFPNLVSITFKCNYLSSLITDPNERESDTFYLTEEMCRSNRNRFENEGNIWPSVTQFTWDGDGFCRFIEFQNFQFSQQIAKLFPNVKDVTFRSYDKLSSACGILWTAWPELETIACVNLTSDALYKCMDQDFSGMTKKQCDNVREAILEGTDCTKLIKKYQTKPSIRNLKKLKSLRIEFTHDRYECRSRGRNPEEVFLTEVTKKCALDLMPGLDFKIVRNSCTPSDPEKKCRFSMEHLQPNVKLISTEPFKIINYTLM